MANVIRLNVTGNENVSDLRPRAGPGSDFCRTVEIRLDFPSQIGYPCIHSSFYISVATACRSEIIAFPIMEVICG